MARRFYLAALGCSVRAFGRAGAGKVHRLYLPIRRFMARNAALISFILASAAARSPGFAPHVALQYCSITVSKSPPRQS